MKLLIDEVKHIRFSRLEFCEDFPDCAGVGRVLDLEPRVTLTAEFEHNNNFVLGDIPGHDFLSDD